MLTTAKLFVTDYASYNEGKQFKFGHWVELNDFTDAEEFNEYLTNHFNNVVGLQDFEPMYTDFEGFPASLYSESLSNTDLEKIFKYIEIGYEGASDSEKVSFWNEYASENCPDDQIFDFDDEFFEMFFSNKPKEAARAASFGTLNWSDDYIKFNGYGNLESFSNPINEIDENELINWLLENR